MRLLIHIFVSNYSYNPNGICGSTASAMWLMYIDKYKNESYVASNLETDDGISLINVLVSYIDGDEPGSTPAELTSGLQRYLNTRSVIKTLSNVAWNSSTYMAQIKANNPVIIDLDSHPTYNEHWVVGYGYNTTSSGALSTVTVNDGHGNSGIIINPIYIGRIVY